MIDEKLNSLTTKNELKLVQKDSDIQFNLLRKDLTISQNKIIIWLGGIMFTCTGALLALDLKALNII